MKTLIAFALLALASFAPVASAQYETCWKCNFTYQIMDDIQCRTATCIPAAEGQQGRTGCTGAQACSAYPGPLPQGYVTCTFSGSTCRAQADPFCNECILEGYPSSWCCSWGCAAACNQSATRAQEVSEWATVPALPMMGLVAR